MQYKPQITRYLQEEAPIIPIHYNETLLNKDVNDLKVIYIFIINMKYYIGYIYI